MMFIPRAFQGWDILVVDDEPDSLEVAYRLLKLAGASVTVARNGQEALEKVTQQRPKFILTDLSMPDVDGWEFLYQLKQVEANVGIPVIALTAHGMTGDRERVMAAGFHNHITKPLDPTKLIQQLINLLVELEEFKPLLEAYV
jgi:CheY-like chemotaxis protein